MMWWPLNNRGVDEAKSGCVWRWGVKRGIVWNVACAVPVVGMLSFLPDVFSAIG